MTLERYELFGRKCPEVAGEEGEAQRLAGGAERYLEVPTRVRITPTAASLRDVGRNRYRRSPQLGCQSEALVSGKPRRQPVCQ